MNLPPRVAALFSPEMRERLTALRRELHRHPELSSQEEETAQRLYEELAALEPAALDRVAGTGVVARIRGRDPGAPVVAIRGDIDALPIQEGTGLPFASERPGIMHACGHDVHAAWTVGAAHLLSKAPGTGDVCIVLQPAEETGRGALAVLASGALDGVSVIFGAHVDRRYPVGQVVADAGPLAAAADTFEIELVGSGGHGARPHECIDPIVGAGALIGAVQTITSRRLGPARAAVVTIGTVHGGTAANIIPDRVKLAGTLRALDPETRQVLQRELRRIAESTAAAYRLKATLTIEPGPPPLVNAPEAVQWARGAAAALLGGGSLVPFAGPNMASEDYAFYLEKIRGCFLRIGAREEGGEPIPAHSPRFYAAEESIFVGAAVLAEAARIASQELRG
ncbi:MAG: amidohydrolase [Gemmatimonadetes bacterium]|nr:amidohydrolase [Gemmatimonadota bacterium]